MNRFGVTHQTAIHTLRRLVDLDILLEYTGRQRNQQFLAPAIMSILT
ncbi:MAG: hypothetical protein HUU23_03840 [Caldilineales bacterium]|nr:hypothetical protein [Caldilineales bacterium]